MIRAASESFQIALGSEIHRPCLGIFLGITGRRVHVFCGGQTLRLYLVGLNSADLEELLFDNVILGALVHYLRSR